MFPVKLRPFSCCLLGAVSVHVVDFGLTPREKNPRQKQQHQAGKKGEGVAAGFGSRQGRGPKAGGQRSRCRGCSSREVVKATGSGNGLRERCESRIRIAHFGVFTRSILQQWVVKGFFKIV